MAIEANRNSSAGRRDRGRDPPRHGRRRRGRLHRRRCTASPPGSTTTTSSSPARSRRAPTRRCAPAARSASPKTASTATTRRWRRPRRARADGIEVGRDRHAEPPARAGRRGVPEGRHPRDLRQAAGDARRAMRAACAALAEQPAASSPSPTTTPAIRWCGRPAQMVADGQLGDDPRRPGRVRAGLADRAARSERPEAGRLAHRSGALGRRRLHRRHRHARATSSPATSAGCEVSELCAELSTFVAGRRLDDNAQVLLRFANGARGALWASQVAPGNENDLRLRVYGSRGGLEWRQEQPNQLAWSPFGEPTQTISRASAGAGPAAAPRDAHRRPAIPRATSRRSPPSTARSRRPIRAARPGGAEVDPAVAVSRASTTAPRASSSSRPRSPRRAGDGRSLGPTAAARAGRPSIETLIDLFIDVIDTDGHPTASLHVLHGHHR